MEIVMLFGAFFILMAANCSIAFSMLLSAFTYVLVKGIPLTLIPERITSGLDSFPRQPFLTISWPENHEQHRNDGQNVQFLPGFYWPYQGRACLCQRHCEHDLCRRIRVSHGRCGGVGLTEIKAMKDDGL